MLKKIILSALAVAVVGFVIIQVIPYGRAHSNPPVLAEPAWDSIQTRTLAARACFDCHSNETKWPWYSNIAPVSWLIQNSVNSGRSKLNFSEWGSSRFHEAGEAAETVQEGEMPPSEYLWLHPSAKLSADERLALIQGLEATFGREQGGNDREKDDDDD